jgi:hypothetical protein
LSFAQGLPPDEDDEVELNKNEQEWGGLGGGYVNGEDGNDKVGSSLKNG